MNESKEKTKDESLKIVGIVFAVLLLIAVSLVSYAFGKDVGKFEAREEARKLGIAEYYTDKKDISQKFRFIPHPRKISYIYQLSTLKNGTTGWVVGYYLSDDKNSFKTESEHGSKEAAANQVHWLNGREVKG